MECFLPREVSAFVSKNASARTHRPTRTPCLVRLPLGILVCLWFYAFRAVQNAATFELTKGEIILRKTAGSVRPLIALKDGCCS